ncbi:chitin-inducible gibberellin-responsive protein 1-like [Magnolia sinica]|uniref:chitin-inducible gibberellin-responsive protein 1-like n=1 Tax=Magnolia sinica TaxID=86752 RepID=UPI00265B0999|nr:chitin-inducible gibberellin-responsive protein 1-like [Magnolia sinica]XP_058072937.1 chitin-inducible gibberellin-responsive protein 1-like [Magnolia sinica]XP_058072938.1 chitin-inducible gibberellin-responsive protein 1-like [Magnolia sinica]
MDLNQLFRFGPPNTNISPATAPASTLLHSEWMLRPTKFDSGSSPSSPLSTHFDHDTLSTLSNSQEQYSSTENFLNISPSGNRSLEIDSSFQASPANIQEVWNNHSIRRSSTHDVICSMKDALHELETTLMGPDTDEVSTPSSTFVENQQPESSNQISRAHSHDLHQEAPTVVRTQLFVAGKHREMISGAQWEKRQRLMDTHLQDRPLVDVKQLLMECARAISDHRMDDFNKLLPEARSAVSISGEPIQRLGAYMLEGLVARLECSGTNIYRALRCQEPESHELLSYMQILYDICPYFKFGYMAANGAIAEAFRNEDRLHIIDFQIAMGTQWVTLLQALAARPGGPPHVRITGIDDPVARYARGDGLQAVGKKLAALSEKFNIPVEFHAVPVFGDAVTREMLDVRPGEALAVNFTLQLHHTPDESVDVNNPRDGLLRMVKSLSPKVTTLVEQESNTNTTPFLMRFQETLDYYSAMFESIDVTLPRDSRERIKVEQHCLAKDIVNVIACEGKDRIERHELLGKWRSRLSMAGFQQFPLSGYVNSVIRSLLRCYSENYTLVEKDGAMLLGWKDRNLISASAWH